MNPIKANFSALRNIMNLNSRAPRREYWWVLITLIGGIILGIVINVKFFPSGGGSGVIRSWLKFAYILFILIWLMALFTVSIRRLHDLDKSGIWMFSYIIFLPLGLILVSIMSLKPGTPGPNRFGLNPDEFDDIEDSQALG